MQYTVTLSMLISCIAMTSCSPTLYEEYLTQSLHRASQDDIVKQLGSPHTAPLKGGDLAMDVSAMG